MEDAVRTGVRECHGVIWHSCSLKAALLGGCPEAAFGGGSAECTRLSPRLNAHAVKERLGASGVGVGVAGRARLPEDVRGQERERRG